MFIRIWQLVSRDSRPVTNPLVLITTLPITDYMQHHSIFRLDDS